MELLSERIDFAMKKRNLNANSLANLVGVTRPAMAKILNGDTREPKKIFEIAAALGVLNGLKQGKAKRLTLRQKWIR